LEPLKYINRDNFSIRWKGYIESPATGNYYFKTMSDDGNRFKINGEYLIAHNMNKNGKEFSILSNVINLDKEETS